MTKIVTFDPLEIFCHFQKRHRRIKKQRRYERLNSSKNVSFGTYFFSTFFSHVEAKSLKSPCDAVIQTLYGPY